ncbi:MAG TPA: hypothetical protein VEA18_02320 [Candidatus Kapabacteria bacterium]|nr:hypothetical protein [Candidatus Kapabacteria bacterium]
MSEKLYPLKLYLRHRPHLILLSIAALFHLSIWVVILGYVRPQDDPIFLHYNILFGVDLLGVWWKVYYVPLGGLAILLTNALIGWLLFQKDKFISYLLLGGAMVCQVFILIAAILLILLNI